MTVAANLFWQLSLRPLPCQVLTVSGLHVEPEMGGHTEDCFQSRGGVLGDWFDALDDPGDRRLIQTCAFSQFPCDMAKAWMLSYSVSPVEVAKSSIGRLVPMLVLDLCGYQVVA